MPYRLLIIDERSVCKTVQKLFPQYNKVKKITCILVFAKF